MAYLAGKNASIQIGATTLAAVKCTLSGKTGEVNVTNFTSGGVENYIAGLVGGDLSATGIIEDGTLPDLRGTVQSFTFTLTSGHTISGSILVNEQKWDADLAGAVTCDISGKLTGTITVT